MNYEVLENTDMEFDSEKFGTLTTINILLWT